MQNDIDEIKINNIFNISKDGINSEIIEKLKSIKILKKPKRNVDELVKKLEEFNLSIEYRKLASFEAPRIGCSQHRKPFIDRGGRGLSFQFSEAHNGYMMPNTFQIKTEYKSEPISEIENLLEERIRTEVDNLINPAKEELVQKLLAVLSKENPQENGPRCKGYIKKQLLALLRELCNDNDDKFKRCRKFIPEDTHSC